MPDPDLLARGVDLLAAAVALTGMRQEASEIAEALGTDDPRARAAVVMLEEGTAAAARALARRCAELARAERWAELEPVARLTEASAYASRRLRENVTALITLARARRHLGDLRGALTTATDLVTLGESVGDRSVCSTGHDERARALVALGRHDEALREFGHALQLEEDPGGRLAILQARSDAYVELGELRAAVAELSHVIDELDVPATPPEELAIALDNTASAVAALGDRLRAAELLERAANLLGPGTPLGARAINALLRADALAAMDDRQGAERAFGEAHELAFEWARADIDRDHYREGFARARDAAAGLPAEAGALWAQGVMARDQGLEPALSLWGRAQAIARAAGDEPFALRIDANAAALLLRFKRLDRAAAICRDVARGAAALGLAQVEAMAWGTLAGVAGGGGDLQLPAGPLGALARAEVLHELQDAFVREAGLQGPEADMATFDSGAGHNNLGVLARRCHALALARAHFSAAVASARELDAPYELANRLGNLLDVLDRLDDDAAEAVARELAEHLEREDLPLDGRIAALKVLGEHAARSDPDTAITRLEAARDAIEELRRTDAPGPARTDEMRDFHSVHRLLSRLLRRRGDAAGAFDAMQGIKGRRLVDALAAQHATDAGAIRDDAPTSSELQTMLTGSDSVIVDLVVEEDGIAAHVISADSVSSAFAPGAVAEASEVEYGDSRERQRRLVRLCLSQPLLARLAAEVEAAAPEGAPLLIVPDGILHNLPLHAVPLNGAPWGEHRRLGYIAAAGALRFAPGHRPATGRALVAGDSSKRMPLAHAAQECTDVAALLGVTPLVGPGECTRHGVEAALSDGEYDVVHLAVHGRGDARHGGRASLLLGEDEWVAFEELAALTWRAELVVFSGCSTAVSGPRHARDFLSVAEAAAEAGAAAVIACLWPVGDAAAAVFMRTFYEWLVPTRSKGPADLREGLDVARIALRQWVKAQSHEPQRPRDGREVAPEVAFPDDSAEAEDAAVADAVQWAPFVVIGDPIVGG